MIDCSLHARIHEIFFCLLMVVLPEKLEAQFHSYDGRRALQLKFLSLAAEAFQGRSLPAGWGAFVFDAATDLFMSSDIYVVRLSDAFVSSPEKLHDYRFKQNILLAWGVGKCRSLSLSRARNCVARQGFIFAMPSRPGAFSLNIVLFLVVPLTFTHYIFSADDGLILIIWGRRRRHFHFSSIRSFDSLRSLRAQPPICRLSFSRALRFARGSLWPSLAFLYCSAALMLRKFLASRDAYIALDDLLKVFYFYAYCSESSMLEYFMLMIFTPIFRLSRQAAFRRSCRRYYMIGALISPLRIERMATNLSRDCFRLQYWSLNSLLIR